MSDHWETFPCQMGDRLAWISYDHGIRDGIDTLPFPNCARFKVVLRDPDDRGMPRGSEFDELDRIEDRLDEGIRIMGGCQVGRITTDGARHFIFYTNAGESGAQALAREAQSIGGHRILVAHESDPERSAYWKELFPTEDDWQVIRDLSVQHALEENGDTLQEARPIDHWAYFPTDRDRDRFIDQVGSRFESVHPLTADESRDGTFGVRLRHTGLPDYGSMNAFTIALSRAAREHNGDYDGWETEVRKG